jgi:uncharacterized protein
MNPLELVDIQRDIEQGKTPDSPLFTSLAQDGFFVAKDTDERTVRELVYRDQIYENTLSTTILASEQCNFRCKYCYEDFKRGNITGDIIESFLLFARKSIQKYSRISIDWFGGEPLLADKEIEQISEPLIQLCQKAGRPYTASMTTNGYLLTPDMLRRMLRSRIYSFQITIDGTAETHNNTRVLANGGPTFDTIIYNLREIRDTIKSQLFKIIIRTNISKLQLPYIDEYIKFLHAEFGNDSRFQFYFRPAGDWGGERVKSMRDSFVSSFEELYEPLLNNISKMNVDIYVSLLKKSMCDAANRNSFVLGSDGTIYKCTMLFNKDFNRIGKLNYNGNIDIDRNKLARWIASPDIPTRRCSACSNWALCHNRSCPANIFSDDEVTNESCGYEKKSLNYILMFLDKAGSAYVKTYQW